MSAVTRRPVGDPVLYRGSSIIARYIGPDLLCEVDGNELPNFYINRTAAINAGQRFIDARASEREKKAS